jgi:hypothetical protein
LLFGSAFFLVPGIGHVMILGPVASWIIGALENAVVVGGMSALGAGLYSIGIPKDSILQYETALKADKFLVIANGTNEEAEKARSLLDKTSENSCVVHCQ